MTAEPALPEPYFEDDTVTLFLGKCEEQLRGLLENSVHAVICDPPYGMSQEPDIAEVLKHWLAGDDYKAKGGGFMGRSWDSFVPGPSIWREIRRVLKPGGMLAAFASTRTADLMGIAIRIAGFERRDTIVHVGSEVYVLEDATEMMWVYGSGFPKDGDLGVEVDKALGHTPREVTREVERGYDGARGFSMLEEHEVVEEAATRASGIGSAYKGAAGDGTWKEGAGTEQVVNREPVSDEGKQWRGWSTTLKPANEPIILARKPISEKNVPLNVVKHGTGGYNIAGAAIGSGKRFNPPSAFKGDREAPVPVSREGFAGTEREGRWPPNVIVSHTEGCELVASMKAKAQGEVTIGPSSRPHQGYSGSGSGSFAGAMVKVAHVAEDGTEMIDVWDCVDGCQVRAMDMQGAGEVPWRAVRTLEGSGFSQGVTRFMYCAKPTRAEKDAGITGDGSYVAQRAGGSGIAKDERFRALVKAKVAEGLSEEAAAASAQEEMSKGAPRNTHLTVKPIDLMRWLVRLLCPPGGTVLDPFMGSGTTGCATMMEPGGYTFVGCEMEEEQCRNASQRIVHWRSVAAKSGGEQMGLL